MLQEIAPGNNTSLLTYLSFGRYREALDLFAAGYPELDCAGSLNVNRNNLFPALNLSLALEKAGDRTCAIRILEKVREQLTRMPRLGARGSGIADVEVHARFGELRAALDTLRGAIDAGWRGLWWAQGERSPHIGALAVEPEFTAMMDEIRLDMSAQLERVRALDRQGALPLVPPPRTATE